MVKRWTHRFSESLYRKYRRRNIYTRYDI